MPAVLQGSQRLVDQGEDPRPQRLAEDGDRTPSAAGGGRPTDQAEVHGPDQGPAADLRAVLKPADEIPESYRRYLINSIRESFDLPGVPIRMTVKSNKNPYAKGEEKAGQGLRASAVRSARRAACRPPA
jgi:hypothetical protein